jgi:hypothetical protein
MMPAEYQLMIALATIICSGLISAIVTYKLNSRKDERLILRQKLEELNLALIRYCKQLGCVSLMYSSVMAGKITYDQANEQIVGFDKGEEKSHDKVSMLVNIYFPHFKPYLDNIMEIRDDENNIRSDFKRHYQRNGKPSQDHFNKICDISVKMDKAEADFMNALQREAEKIKRYKFQR